MDEVLCCCGRPNDRTHCPTCGSFDTAAKPSKAFKVRTDGGGFKKIMMYRCRKCGKDFDDLQISVCWAPPERRGSRDVKQIERTPNPEFEGLSLEERIAKAKEILSRDKKDGNDSTTKPS